MINILIFLYFLIIFISLINTYNSVRQMEKEKVRIKVRVEDKKEKYQ